MEIVSYAEVEKCLERLTAWVTDNYEPENSNEKILVIQALLTTFTESFGTENYDNSRDTGFKENFWAYYKDLEFYYKNPFSPSLDNLKEYFFDNSFIETTRGLHPFFIIQEFIEFSLENRRIPSTSEFIEAIRIVNNPRLPLEHAIGFLEWTEENVKLAFNKFQRDCKNFSIYQWGIRYNEILEWLDNLKEADI